MTRQYWTMFIVSCWLSTVPVFAEWPMWQADAARSGYTSAPLPAQMSRQWTWEPLHAPQPAWPRDERMSFDRAAQVIAVRGFVFFGSSVDGQIYSLDAETGELQWMFSTDGPIRFAPVAWQNRLYAVSDDGHLYCLNADTGALVDRWRGGPADDRVLGNGRIVSRWPARGGPVVYEGVLYWGAGIWQSEQIFLHALDLATHQVVWTNDTSGGIDMPQPHGGAQAKSGVSAQGYLLANADRLFVPTGRAVPAAFTRSNGQFEYYRLQENTKRGGTTAMLAGALLYNGGHAYQLHDGGLLPDQVAGVTASFADGIVIGSRNVVRALKPTVKAGTDRQGNPLQVATHEVLWQITDVPAGTAMIVAGKMLITSDEHRIAAVDVTTQQVLWSEELADPAYGFAAADERLFVSSASGAIHGYAAGSVAAPTVHRSIAQTDVYGDNAAYARAATEILKRSKVTDGYCVDLGCGDGALAHELAQRTSLHIVAIDEDPANVAEARRKLAAAGLYGARVTVLQGDPAQTHFPKYFANLVVSGRSVREGGDAVPQSELRRLQRPYGGVAAWGSPDDLQIATSGALPSAGEWTHLYANAANALCSTDEIKGPLSVLWFRDVDLELPQRHGRGPSPLFHEGRLFAQGVDGLRAVDAYNGRSLWHFELKGILAAYDADHLAGTAVTGSNMCLADDAVFLRHEDRCYRIDAATGQVKHTYTAPPLNDGQRGTWGYLACEQGILFGSLADEQHIVRHAYIRADAHMQQQYSESVAFFAIDVGTGELLWRHDAQHSLRNNAIAIGGGKVYLIDRTLALDDLLSRAPARRGEAPATPPVGHPTGELLALEASTGKQLWYSREDIFGTTLAVSPQHDVLLMFYQPTSFRLPSEVGGRISAFSASRGERLWDQSAKYNTRPLINDQTVIAWPSSLNLLSGEVTTLPMVKSYGCGQISGSKNLLMFRSATLGYFDTTRAAGTENFGGIRPGCWINALPVGGLVLVPDASAGCTCSYQNRSWVALQGTD